MEAERCVSGKGRRLSVRRCAEAKIRRCRRGAESEADGTLEHRGGKIRRKKRFLNGIDRENGACASIATDVLRPTDLPATIWARVNRQ